MKLPFLICALCLALLLGFSGCGGDDATSSETQESSAATTADGGGEGGADGGESADSEGDATPADDSFETQPSKVVIGEYDGEGPFSAVSGGKGDEKPKFEPSGEPAPKEIVSRDLVVGTGPAAKRGDQVALYYAGALYETGKVTLYGWPPGKPANFALGESVFGKSWEKTIEGMKVGGLRQVIIPESEWAQQKPVDYVIILKDLQPK
jgi:FKBP-type peptidyl-prolyl cis-trans isomerase